MTHQFKRTTHERYWEMLGCVPPAAQNSIGFLVGEAWDHEGPNGRARYSAFFHKRAGDEWERFCGSADEYYEACEPMTRLEFASVTMPDIRANLAPA